MKFFKTWKFWIPASIIVLAIILGVLQYTHVTHFFAKNSSGNTIYYPGPHTSSGGQYTKGSSTAPSIVQSNPSPKTPPESQLSPNAATNAYLLSPKGDFVNNHHPTMSGATSNMFSVCNTTPGAKCGITFTNTLSGTIKSLNSETTDNNGAAYWSWTPGQIGLNAGSTWRVTATATLNGQSKSSTDAINLEVQ